MLLYSEILYKTAPSLNKKWFRPDDASKWFYTYPKKIMTELHPQYYAYVVYSCKRMIGVILLNV